jgi:hypothetical protein
MVKILWSYRVSRVNLFRDPYYHPVFKVITFSHVFLFQGKDETLKPAAFIHSLKASSSEKPF